MSRLRQLIHEVHRRSLWQVLGIYVLGGWLVLQVVDTLAGALNLPEWAPPLALFMLIIGLPIVLATAFVQEGVGRREPGEVETTSGGTPVPSTATNGGSNRLLTWRNALLGGLTAFALWGVFATAWLFFGPDVRPRAAEATADRDLRSIAVLPFATRAAEGDQEAEIFSAGVHDDLLTQLSKLDSLKVIARTSVMRYRDTEMDIREIAAQLEVATILEGSVDVIGDRVRVNVQLIDAETNDHLWAETYDEQLTAANIFAIRTDLATRVAEALRATMTPQQEVRIAAEPTEDLEAYSLYTRGRYFWNERTLDGFERSIEYYRQAIERDSSYALAYAGIADSYSMLALYNHMTREEALPLARAAAERALELDGSLGEAHAAMGAVHEGNYDMAAAERSYKRAIELSPSYATAHQWYAQVLSYSGRLSEALAHMARANELDPLSGIISADLSHLLRIDGQFLESLRLADRTIELLPDFSPAHSSRAFGLAQIGQLDEALTSARKAAAADPASGVMPSLILYYQGEYDVAADNLHRLIELRPGDLWSHWALSGVQAARGRYDEAIAAIEQATELDPGNPFLPLSTSWVYAMAGRVDEARAILADVEKLRDDPAWPQVLPGMVTAHAALGDHDRAFELLDEAVAANVEPWAPRDDPGFDALRADPRFDAFLARIGLDDASVDSIVAAYRAGAE